MTKEVICPICSQADQVDKVSAIYVKGIERKYPSRSATSPGQSKPQSIKTDPFDAMPSAELQALSRRLAPPSSKREISRPIHPDMVVLVFSLVAPIFLYGIWTNQTAALPVVLLVLVGFYGIYFWKRKPIVARFEAQKLAQQVAAQRIQRGIERWLRLYYCVRDDSVFEPGASAFVPADQIAGYLLRE